MILLIQPPSRERGKLIFPPLGLMAIAALPDAAGHKVEILDANVTPMEQVKHRIRTANPTVVGITSFTGPMLAGAVKLSQYARQHTNATIVWGGVHASILPEQTLADPSVDVVVTYEGDFTFMQLLENLNDFSRVPGIFYKVDGQIVSNPRRGLISDLKVLPPFPWHLVDVEKYIIPWAQARRTLPLISSRGCPYRCTFCYNKVFNDQKWRGFPLSRITNEIDYLADRYNLDGVRFDASDLFIGPGKTGRKFALDIVRHAAKRNLKWSAQVRTNQVDVPLLKEFGNNGCNYLFYGIESGSKRILKEMYKDVKLDNIHQVVEATNDLKIMSAAGVMYDFPGETMADFRQTVRLFRTLRILVRFSALQPYPGTPAYEVVQDRNLLKFPTDTMGWTTFDYDHPHGLSEIPDVKKKAARWHLKYNYLHNLEVTLRRKDYFFLKTMTESFVKYYAQNRRKDTYELNY